MDRRAGNSGFSLIEVLIAIAILMIGLSAIISLQVSGIRWLAQAKHKTAATQVASQVVELLKIAPINIDSAGYPEPHTVMKLTNGYDVVDNLVERKAMLDDFTPADGLNTWHRLSPMDPNGNQCFCMSTNCDEWRGNCYYLVAYGVEWGGKNGSHFVQAAGGSNPNANAWYPQIIPGAFEAYIEVWVGWVEPGDHVTINGNPVPSVKDYWVAMASSFPNFPAVFPKHKVVLTTIRRLPLPKY